MENGLNFGKAIEAAKEEQSGRMDGTGECSHIVPASQYPAITGVAKRILGRRKTLYLIAHIGLLKLLKGQQPGLLLEAILSLKTGQY
jgi:hypothetical protein